jgi:ribosomal subunit interface protein
MHVTVSGKQLDVGESLQRHVSAQLASVVGKYLDRAVEARVTFSRDRSAVVCGIDLHAHREVTLRAEGAAPSAYAAFGTASTHLAKRLRRYRRRVNEHARGSAEQEREKATRPPDE